MATDARHEDTTHYTPFEVEGVLEVVLNALKIQDRGINRGDGESCERRVAMLLYVLGHCVVPTKDTCLEGAPMSRTLKKSYRLPDYMLDDDGSYVEAKYRRRPHILYDDDLGDHVDVESPVKSLPIRINAMDDYAERSSDHDTTVYLVVWDNKHDNLVYAEVSELDGTHLATDVIGGDDVYCYDYDAFAPVSPFAGDLDMN